MALPACIASLATHSGQLHIFTEKALEIVIDRIPLDRTDGKLEGYDIFQWAAFAKKKSSIASSICRELGSLKASRSASALVQDCNLDPLCRSDPWAGASFKLSDSASKQPGDEAAVHEHHMEKAPLWQKYFSRPSEQDVQGAQDVLGHGFEQPPRWQKIPVKPSEPEAIDGSVVQVDGDGHQLADKWRKITGKALVQQRHVSAMKSKAMEPAVAVCAEGNQPMDVAGAKVTALHVEWPAVDDDELSMDDVVDYFEGFGQILGIDVPGCPHGRSMVKLDFVYGEPDWKVLRLGKHVIARADDGKQIAVKVYVKLDTRRKDTRQ